MSGESTTPTRSQITGDPDTVRSWSETHTLVPVRVERGGEQHLEVVREDAAPSGAEELSWDEFERELESENMLVVRHGDEDAEYEVVSRSELIGEATIEREEVEEALLEGETVRAQLTETTVVEHTIVEDVTVESEIVDREVIESAVVDVEHLTTDVDHCTVSRTEPPEETVETAETLQPGARTTEPYDVEIAVDESWSLAREVVERITVESRIVAADVDETETVESDTLRETVDVEGVQQTVLEGELVASPEAAAAAVDQGRVESQFREDDVVETHLIRQQTVDEELSVRKEITGEVSDAETVSADAVSHVVVESDIVDEDEYGYDLAAAVDREATTGEARDVSGTGAVDADEVGTADAGETAGSAAAGVPEETDEVMTPSEDDEGKTVVNASGDEVGMVVDVEGGRLYVDPHPSITDRIRTALGWGDHDDDTYPVENEHIARIEDDRVVLGVEREG